MYSYSLFAQEPGFIGKSGDARSSACPIPVLGPVFSSKLLVGVGGSWVARAGAFK